MSESDLVKYRPDDPIEWIARWSLKNPDAYEEFAAKLVELFAKHPELEEKLEELFVKQPEPWEPTPEQREKLQAFSHLFAKHVDILARITRWRMANPYYDDLGGVVHPQEVAILSVLLTVKLASRMTGEPGDPDPG